MQPSAFSTLHSIDMIDAGKMIDSAQGKDLVTIQLNLEMYVDVMGLQWRIWFASVNLLGTPSLIWLIQMDVYDQNL